MCCLSPQKDFPKSNHPGSEGSYRASLFFGYETFISPSTNVVCGDVKMLTIKEVAEILDGNEYADEMLGLDLDEVRKSGIVVVFGYSDDNIEFRGAIDEELGCYGGGVFYLTKEGLVENCDEECAHFQRAMAKAVTIEAFWCKEGGPDWSYETDIPHETFMIMEDGTEFCRGIVFKLSDAK